MEIIDQQQGGTDPVQDCKRPENRSTQIAAEFQGEYYGYANKEIIHSGNRFQISTDYASY